MQRQDVTSTMIRSIGHDPENSILEIEFNSGTIWNYYDFSESAWHDFVSCESYGKYFHSNIRGQYREGRIG